MTSVKSLAQVERFMQTIRRKATTPDPEVMAHLNTIHEHVLALLGIDDDDPDDEDVEDDDPDYIDDDAKSILAELPELTELATA